MIAHSKVRIVLGFVIATLLGTSAARAQFGGIQDNAAFFSEAAKSEATRNINEIGKHYKKDISIETFKAMPDDIKASVNGADKAATGRVFEQWAVRQARLKHVNGIYVLLLKEPAHLQIVVGNETQKQAFTLADRDSLVSLMLGKLRAKQNDAALLDGVSFVNNTLRAHVTGHKPLHSSQARPAQAESSSPFGSILSIVLVIGVIWVIVGVIRSLFNRGASAGVGGMGFWANIRRSVP